MPYAIRPDVNGISALAHCIDHLRDVKDRTAPVYGVALHTTGSGVVDKALKLGSTPFDIAVATYTKPDAYAAHYVVDYDGTIAQIGDEHEDLQHVGYISDGVNFRQVFLSGEWEKQLPDGLVQRWKQRWPGVKSPAHLFPGPAPNNVYVGVEMVPWDSRITEYAPRAEGMRYTQAQHDAVADLCKDIATRWGISFQKTGSLACHEDLNPIQRSAKGEGWDPGILRVSPWFDWDYLLDHTR